jgi:histidinol-phosphate phosphatase family protein
MRFSRTFAITSTGAPPPEIFDMAENGNAALFFDLAGTLVKMDATRQLPLDHDGNIVIELLPGVAEKLRPIRDHLMLVFTNQAGIERGRFTMATMEAALADLDHQLGDILSGWLVCPHDDDDHCECRKPKAGMIVELAETFGVDLNASTGVGDQLVDEQACEAGGVARFIYAKDFFGWK